MLDINSKKIVRKLTRGKRKCPCFLPCKNLTVGKVEENTELKIEANLGKKERKKKNRKNI